MKETEEESFCSDIFAVHDNSKTNGENLVPKPS